MSLYFHFLVSLSEEAEHIANTFLSENYCLGCKYLYFKKFFPILKNDELFSRTQSYLWKHT